MGLVLWGVGPILRNWCEHQGQNYVAFFQGSEMSGASHSENLILVIQCCRLSVLIVCQWPNRHNNKVWSRRSEIIMLCYPIYVKNVKIHFITSNVSNQNLSYIECVNFALFFPDKDWFIWHVQVNQNWLKQIAILQRKD